MGNATKDQSICIEVVSSKDKVALIEEKSCIAKGREESDIDDGFFICDLGAILSKYQEWVKTLPRIVPFYAVKCNSDSTMLKTLLALGTGFDCASKKEIRTLLELGAQPEKIIYANPLKQASHIRYARDVGVKRIVFDCEEELFKMKANYPQAELILRIQANRFQGVHKMSKKFGADIELSHRLIDAAREMDLQVTGISFHVGGLCPSPEVYFKALKDARTLFDYAETVGYKFNLLDIGGGFSGTDEAEVKFKDIAPIVDQHISALFRVDMFKHVRVIAEPGRYFAESAFTLATNIIAKKKITKSILIRDTKDSDEESQNGIPSPEEPAFKYIINDGVHGSFSYILHGMDGPLPVLLKPPPNKSATFMSCIFGPTLNPEDLVVKRRMLPELKVSDWIVWHNMGAYTSTLSCNFNGFMLSCVYYVISEDDLAIFRGLTQGKDSFGLVWGESNS